MDYIFYLSYINIIAFDLKLTTIFFAYRLDTVNALPSTYTDKFRSMTVMELNICIYLVPWRKSFKWAAASSLSMLQITLIWTQHKVGSAPLDE